MLIVFIKPPEKTILKEQTTDRNGHTYLSLKCNVKDCSPSLTFFSPLLFTFKSVYSHIRADSLRK